MLGTNSINIHQTKEIIENSIGKKQPKETLHRNKTHAKQSAQVFHCLVLLAFLFFFWQCRHATKTITKSDLSIYKTIKSSLKKKD